VGAMPHRRFDGRPALRVLRPRANNNADLLVPRSSGVIAVRPFTYNHVSGRDLGGRPLPELVTRSIQQAGGPLPAPRPCSVGE